MNWSLLNPLKWFAKKSFGVFVHTILDGKFGDIVECPHLEAQPHNYPCLHIPDLTIDEAEILTTHKINWHELPMRMRAELELGEQFLRMSWAQIRPYLEQIKR